MLTQQDVVVDPALSNVSVKYMNDSFIADKIFPMLKTVKQTGKYFVYDKANLRIDDTTRAAGSPANEVGFGLSKQLFSCDDHSLKEFTEDEIQAQAEVAINPLIDATENLTEKLLLDRESKLATILSSTTNLPQNVTLAGVTQWSAYTTSDPIGDIRSARTTIHKSMFRKPNTIIMSQEVFDMISDHPSIIERVKYSQLGILTEELLARVFQVKNILIGEAGMNSSKEGQADVMSYVWGKHVVVAFVAPQVRLRQVTLGYTFTYSTRTVKRWRDEDREGTYVRVGNDNYTQKIVASTAGYLIKNAIA